MDGTAQIVPAARPLETGGVTIARWTLVGSGIVFSFFTAVLLVRSVSGRFVPLTVGLLLSAVTCFAALIDVWRFVARRTNFRWRQRAWVYESAATGLLAAFLFTLSITGTPLWALVAAWCLAIAHEAIYVALVYRHRIFRRPVDSVALPNSANDQTVRSPISDWHVASPPLQRVERWIEEGEDIVVGEFCCVFEPAERQQAIHVVFCPPLSHAPTIELESLSGPPVTLKTSQCFSYGARLDVRLAKAPATTTTVVVRVVARANRH